MGEDGVENLPFSSQIFSSEATNCNVPIFFSLSDTESVIVSLVIPVHALGNQVEIKVAPVLIRLPRSLDPQPRETSG